MKKVVVSLLAVAFSVGLSAAGSVVCPVVLDTVALVDSARVALDKGYAYRTQGNYAQAETYYGIAQRIVEQLFSANSTQNAACLLNLGRVYRDKGEYAKAEQCLLQARKIHQDLGEEKDSNYATILNNLGLIYKDIGSYNKAEQYYLEALHLREELLGKQSVPYATSLNNLSVLYTITRKYVKALDYGLQAAQIYKELLGDSPSYSTAVNTVALLYLALRDYAKAEQYLLEELRVDKLTLSETHPYCAVTLSNLGSLYLYMNDYAKAEEYFREALRIRKEVLGQKHPDYARSLCDIGEVYLHQSDYTQAEEYFEHANLLYSDLFLSSWDFMSENERSKYWQKMQRQYEYLFPSAYYHSHDIKRAYDLQLFVKGLLQTSSVTINRSILESGDSSLVSMWNKIKGFYDRIQILESQGAPAETMRSFRARVEALEKSTIRRSQRYRSINPLLLTWRDVKKALPDQSMAIEFMSVPGDTTLYCALVLTSTDSLPFMVELFTDKQVEPLLQQSTSRQYVDATAQQLSQFIWGPLLPKMQEVDNVYFAATGLLHQLSFEILPYDAQSTMSDRFNMVRLSSTRELVRANPSVKHEKATLYGGIQYNGSVAYLPGTLLEATTIQRLLTDNHIVATLYTALEAGEQSFKALNTNQPDILHIGTHGFYWPDSTARQKDYFTQWLPTREIDGGLFVRQSINPLDRCGLLLAGAGTALMGHLSSLQAGEQDGIVTAKEVSLMDLRNCDLVVLSACETAKGDITGEGVFGLQRAFKMAGVQTIIMSLWPVDDKATQMLMTEFYTNWINHHQPKREAFKNA
ncbi:MAG: CHAT domain-containing protein, partial [Prevotellaceae bacterium]|nr:CHAT domain-containing protein [Candidatus Faecinaster equi]